MTFESTRKMNTNEKMCFEMGYQKAISDLGGNIARLRELADADRDGRCVVLPCKVGDTVYYLKTLSDGKETVIIESSEVKQISINSHGNWLVIAYCHTLNIEYFGKTVFLTRADAEKALEGEQNDR